jgi:hypothetical protein
VVECQPTLDEQFLIKAQREQIGVPVAIMIALAALYALTSKSERTRNVGPPCVLLASWRLLARESVWKILTRSVRYAACKVSNRELV